MNDYLIFVCSYQQAELYSIGLHTVCCEWDLNPQLLDYEADMLTTALTTPSSLDVCLLM